MSHQQQITALHELYRTATGHELRLDIHRQRAWHEWLGYGHTRADLALVAGYLRREIAKGNRNPGALKFSNLILRPDLFEEDLALARAAANIRPRPPATTKVERTGDTTRLVEHDPATDDSTTRPVSEIFDEIKRNLRHSP